MKKTLIICLLSIFCIYAYGQTDSIKIAKRKLAIQNKLILVVPFNTKLYNNEASKDMIETTGLKYNQVQNILRAGLDKSIHSVIADSCRSVKLLESFTTGTDNDLDMIYSYSDYFFDEAQSYNPKKKPLFGKSKIAKDNDEGAEDKKKSKAKKKEQESKYDGELRSEVRNNANKFLHVKFREKDFLKNYSKKDNIDYFLFINQFEIKGDYSDPYKISNQTNARELKVHFSIFDHDGKFIYGSYAIEEIPSTINDPRKVADYYFVKLAKEIIKNIPL